MPSFPLSVVGFRVDLEQIEVILASNGILPVVVEQVGHGRERDGRRVGPTGAIPLTLVAGVGNRKLGMALFSRGGAEGRIKTPAVHKLLPGDRLLRIRQVKVPRRVTVQLAGIG